MGPSIRGTRASRRVVGQPVSDMPAPTTAQAHGHPANAALHEGDGYAHVAEGSVLPREGPILFAHECQIEADGHALFVEGDILAHAPQNEAPRLRYGQGKMPRLPSVGF
jgi:hypothetical protein